MLRTREEINELASGLFSRMLSELMGRFPRVVKEIDKIRRKDWLEFVDEMQESTAQILLNKFDCSD